MLTVAGVPKAAATVVVGVGVVVIVLDKMGPQRNLRAGFLRMPSRLHHRIKFRLLQSHDDSDQI